MVVVLSPLYSSELTSHGIIENMKSVLPGQTREKDNNQKLSNEYKIMGLLAPTEIRNLKYLRREARAQSTRAMAPSAEMEKRKFTAAALTNMASAATRNVATWTAREDQV